MEMDWRQRRTVTVLTAVLLTLLAAVLIVLGIRYRENRQEAPEEGEPLAAASMTVEGYSALVYSNGSTTLSFTVEENGAWAWENDRAFPLRQETINSILALLINWRPQQTLAAEEDLSAYGLDEPTGFLTLTGADGSVRALLEDLRALVFTKCVDYDPSDEALTICGFDTPPAVLTVNYTTDTGVDESLSLTIGAPMLDGSGRYVRLGDSTTVYALPTAALDPLMRVAANGLDVT